MEVHQREVRYYQTDQGKVPFLEWLYSFKDVRTRAAVRVRISRICLGNWGDHRTVGGGIWELRLDLGPGYRIYYGCERNWIVLILCGGDKKTQAMDIGLAKEYWRDYQREE